MRKRGFLTAAAMLGLLMGGVAIQAIAQEAAKPAGGFRDSAIGKFIHGEIGRIMVLHSELNLTAEQKAAFRSTIASHKKEIAETAAPVIAKRKALLHAVLAEKDDATIRAAADDLGKAIGDAAVKAARLHHELKAKVKLTDEQIATIKKFHAETDEAVDHLLKKMCETK